MVTAACSGPLSPNNLQKGVGEGSGANSLPKFGPVAATDHGSHFIYARLRKMKKEEHELKTWEVMGMSKWVPVDGSSSDPKSFSQLPIRSSKDRMALSVKEQVIDNLRMPIDALLSALLVTKRQLAVQLALSPSYISKLMSEEGLPYIKIGRAVRFRPKEVVEWLSKRRMP